MRILQPVNKNALFIATISFLVGTILLISYVMIDWDTLIPIGIFYVLIAFTLNIITLVAVIANSLINYHLYKENVLTVVLFLINIPVAIGYFLIVINLPFQNI